MGRKAVNELVAVILEVYSKILLALIYCPSIHCLGIDYTGRR